MTYALVAAVLMLTGALGGSVGIAYWAFRRYADAESRRVALLEQKLDEGLKMADTEVELQRAHVALAALNDRLERERKARQVVEDSLGNAMEQLANCGDPDGVANLLRSDLERLRALWQEMPEVPEAADDDG
jgi:hypothetical protein